MGTRIRFRGIASQTRQEVEGFILGEDKIRTEKGMLTKVLPETIEIQVGTHWYSLKEVEAFCEYGRAMHSDIEESSIVTLGTIPPEALKPISFLESVKNYFRNGYPK